MKKIPLNRAPGLVWEVVAQMFHNLKHALGLRIVTAIFVPAFVYASCESQVEAFGIPAETVEAARAVPAAHQTRVSAPVFPECPTNCIAGLPAPVPAATSPKLGIIVAFSKDNVSTITTNVDGTGSLFMKNGVSYQVVWAPDATYLYGDDGTVIMTEPNLGLCELIVGGIILGIIIYIIYKIWKLACLIQPTNQIPTNPPDPTVASNVRSLDAGQGVDQFSDPLFGLRLPCAFQPITTNGDEYLGAWVVPTNQPALDWQGNPYVLGWQKTLDGIPGVTATGMTNVLSFQSSTDLKVWEDEHVTARGWVSTSDGTIRGQQMNAITVFYDASDNLIGMNWYSSVRDASGNLIGVRQLNQGNALMSVPGRATKFWRAVIR